MIPATLMVLALALPQEPAGGGFAEASRIYQQVAESPVSGPATLQARVDAVKKRIEDLQAQIERSAQALVSLERQEMEQTMVIQSAFEGSEREKRLKNLGQTVAPKRAVLEENRAILLKDLQGAREDLGSLQLEFDVVRAMQPGKPAGPATAERVEERVVKYFQDKAKQIGLPAVRPLPDFWVRSMYELL
jgi:hypothetical protein